MEKFINHLLGDIELHYFLALLTFAMIGVIISLLIHATNRNAESLRSPYRFNFFFLLRDNWQRIVLNFILIVVTIRFSPDIFGYQVTPFTALLIGVSYDKLGEWLRNKNVLDKKQ